MDVVVGQHVLAKLPQWLALDKNLASRELEGVVTYRTERAIKLVGYASTRPSSNCHRCGREIKNPASLWVGYGPECSEKLGIPRDFTEDQLAAIREKLVTTSKWEGWLPIKSIDLQPLSGSEMVAPPPAPAADPSAAARQAARARCTVQTVRGRLQVRAPFSFKDTLKGIAGAMWDKEVKAWTYPATSAAAGNLMAALPDLEGDAAFEALIAQAGRAERAQAYKTASELPPIPGLRTQAWLHQRQAYWYVEDLPAAMLAMGMGTGKSLVGVATAVNTDAKAILVLCPKSVISAWERQFAVHPIEPISTVTLGGGAGSTAKKRDAAIAALALQQRLGRPIAIILNYESAWREPMSDWLLKQPWDLLIIDESHKLKAPGGVASRFVSKLARRAKKRLALTGTPMPHNPADIYAQYRALDPGIYGTSFQKFKFRYFDEDPFGGRLTVKPSMEDELNEKFHSIAYRVSADVLDLPEAVHVYRTFALSSASAKAYKELAGAFYAEIGGGTVTASNALVKLLRLQQVTSGYVRDDDGQDREVDMGKRDLLADVLDDLAEHEPVVVFARFQHDLDSIHEVAAKLGRTSSELSGRRNDLAAWQAGETDIIAVQIQAGGVGIDLSRAHYGIYYSLGFSLGDYDQSLARIRRPTADGSKPEGYAYVHLLAEGTVDEKVYRALQERRDVIESILAERGK